MANPTTCILGADLRLQGRISGEDALEIRGQVEGSIDLQNKLVIAAGAEVRADISVTDLVIEGTVTGNVLAQGSVTLAAGATMTGDLKTRRISIADGATFKGSIDMDLSA